IRLPAGNPEARAPARQPWVAFDTARCRGRRHYRGGRSMSQLDHLRRLLLGRAPGVRPVTVDNPVSGTLPERCQGNDASQLKLLLADIRDAFGEGLEIASADLVKALVTIEGRPWGKNGKPLTQKKLAQMLKPLGIAPDRIGPENARQRGYKLWAF